MHFKFCGDICPSNFVLEISLNGTDWKEVNRQNNINFIQKEFQQNLNKSFELNYIRIRYIGKTTDGADYLIIGYLEIFGYVYEYEKKKKF